MKTRVLFFAALFLTLTSASAQIIERGQIRKDLASVDSADVYSVECFSSTVVVGYLVHYTDTEITLKDQNEGRHTIPISTITSMYRIPGFHIGDEYQDRTTANLLLHLGGVKARQERSISAGLLRLEVLLRNRNFYMSGAFLTSFDPFEGVEIFESRNNDPGEKINNASLVAGLYYRQSRFRAQIGTGVGWVSGHYGVLESTTYTGWFSRYDHYRRVDFQSITLPVELGVSFQINRVISAGFKYVWQEGSGVDVSTFSCQIGFELQ